MSEQHQKYESVIGIETHAQLLTNTKLFCGCKITFDAEPNTCTCPVCLGLPGCLPSVNEKAVKLGLKVAHALHCTIPEGFYFARKNYFYPDLPKGYQISQFDTPLGTDGFIDIYSDGTIKRVGIQRVHLEEDAAKLSHRPDDKSYIDYNRTGTPLLEIVSKPDIFNGEDAKAFLMELRSILIKLGVSDGNMEEGSLRCEPNISIRLKETDEFHDKTEIKNINSFSSVVRCIDFELQRQSEIVEKQGWDALIPETRGFDATSGSTFVLRKKEKPCEYRYFPEPDLPRFTIPTKMLDDITRETGVLPLEEKLQLVEDCGIDYETASILYSNDLHRYFKIAVSTGSDPVTTANWLKTETFRLLNKYGGKLDADRIKPEYLSELIHAIENNIISNQMAKIIWEEVFKTGISPKEIIETKDLQQISSEVLIEPAVDSVMDEESDLVMRLSAGEEKLLGVLTGKVLRKLGGKGNPQAIRDLLINKISKGKKLT